MLEDILNQEWIRVGSEKTPDGSGLDQGMKREQIQIGLGAESRMDFIWIRDYKGIQSK